MHTKKYTPEEKLERIKLMMEYDSSKTLKENLQENKILLREQSAANAVSDADLLGSTNKFRQWYQFWSDYGVFNAFGFNPTNFLAGGKRTGVKGAVDALDGFVDTEDLQHVMAIIKALDGKCYFDDVEGKNISATERFLQLYQEDEGEDLKDDVNSVGTSTLTSGAEKIKRQIIKLIDTQVAKGCSSSPQKTGDGKKTGGTKPPPTPTPAELKDAKGIMVFQDWLDKNKAGWATGYDGGILNKKGGYGKFGPRTQKAWVTFKDEYLKGGQQTPTQTDTSKKPENSDEFELKSDNFISNTEPFK